MANERNTTDRWVILNSDGEEVGSSETPIELHVVPNDAWRVVRRLDWRKGVDITGQETAARRIMALFPDREVLPELSRGDVLNALRVGNGIDAEMRCLLLDLPDNELLSLLTETVERLVRGEDDFGVRQLVEEVLGDG